MALLKLNEYLTAEEIKAFNQKSDLRATWEITKNWLWISVAFGMVYVYPAVWTIIPALFIIGGKQLGCAIIMHDAGHNALFKAKASNTIWGNVFGAWPIFHNVQQYSPYHLVHHVKAGEAEDPDILLTRGYPTSKKSLIRKFTRDLTGITGLKAFIGLMMMHLGFLKYNLGNKIEKQRPQHLSRNFFSRLSGPIMMNLWLWNICFYLGSPWLYLLWMGAYLTTFQFSLRVRSMAEHSMVPDSENPKQNSRTIYANVLEQVLFAPLHVNYHAEHHLAMSVPSYKLPQLRKQMKEKGKMDYGLTEHGYWPIIRRAASAQ